MENALVNQTVQQLSHSDEVEVLANKIIRKTQQAQRIALEYAIEIGGYLTEAKALLPHGEWGNWLKERVNYSQSTAINFMKLYEEYGDSQESLFVSNSQTIMNLPYTKALKLLAIPEDEREQFVEENNVNDISARELERIIKERDDAIARADAAEGLQTEKENAEKAAEYQRQRAQQLSEQADSLSKDVVAYKEKYEKAKEAEKKAKAKLKELKENPEIPQEVTDKLKAEAEAKAAAEASEQIEKKIAEANDRIEAANLAKLAAEREAAKAQQTAADLQKQLQMSNPDIAEFKVHFINVQEEMMKLRSTLDSIFIKDADCGNNLQEAMKALVKSFARDFEVKSL